MSSRTCFCSDDASDFCLTCLQRFSFASVHKDAGVLNPLMIPAGPLHGMHMLIQ